MAASPAAYVGHTVRVRAVESANLDNIPWLISDCGDQPNAIVLGSDVVEGARQPLYDYRVPDSVMQAGAFNIMVTLTGRIQREAVRSGFQVHDTGCHLLPMSVTNIEAVHVELAPISPEDMNEVRRRFEELLKKYPPPQPPPPSPAG